VLVDAPCSGLGALRRNPDARWRLTPDDLVRFSGLQRTLLERFSRLVKPGGLLVYATCSLARTENEEVVAQASLPGFERVAVEGLLGPAASAVGAKRDLRLWPHLHGTDGFYAAAFRRRG
jgi:16S rRNA (cytosine967-C5)-methyltransferase